MILTTLLAISLFHHKHKPKKDLIPTLPPLVYEQSLSRVPILTFDPRDSLVTEYLDRHLKSLLADLEEFPDLSSNIQSLVKENLDLEDLSVSDPKFRELFNQFHSDEWSYQQKKQDLQI